MSLRCMEEKGSQTGIAAESRFATSEPMNQSTRLRPHARPLVLIQVDNNLALGYDLNMEKASEAARELAKLSVSARRRKWGEKGFRERMQAWGKLGGRPRIKRGNRNGN